MEPLRHERSDDAVGAGKFFLSAHADSAARSIWDNSGHCPTAKVGVVLQRGTPAWRSLEPSTRPERPSMNNEKTNDLLSQIESIDTVSSEPTPAGWARRNWVQREAVAFAALADDAQSRQEIK